MNLLNKISSIAMLLGVFAIIMGFLDMVPKILAWIYLWGEIAAWIIKISLVAGGALVWYLTTVQQAKQQARENAALRDEENKENA
jgi:hypothetical protein